MDHQLYRPNNNFWGKIKHILICTLVFSCCIMFLCVCLYKISTPKNKDFLDEMWGCLRTHTHTHTVSIIWAIHQHHQQFCRLLFSWNDRYRVVVWDKRKSQIIIHSLWPNHNKGVLPRPWTSSSFWWRSVYDKLETYFYFYLYTTYTTTQKKKNKNILLIYGCFHYVCPHMNN